jgi:hypothetical protein
MERRRVPKLEINLSCRLSSPRLGAAPLVGVTENMSRGDVVVVVSNDGGTCDLLSMGDPVVVEIDLPANHAFGRKCMQCQTTVVRSSRNEYGAARLAMRIHKMRFQSRGEGSALHQGPGGEITRQLLM